MSELSKTSAVIAQGMREGLHVGAQVYVFLRGQTVAELAVGLGRPGVAMHNDTLMLWLSASKPVAAVAIAQLGDAGRLGLDDHIVEHIPEFGANGKDAVTVRHILMHTAGFRGVAAGWSSAPWEQIIAQICAARLEPGWVPGQKAGYHVGSGWFILGELVRRIDGRPFEHYVREEIFEPLGMQDSWIGMPAERYSAYGTRIGLMHSTQGPTPTADFFADTLEGATVCRPGGNGRGPVRELGRFYEMLLNDGQWGERRILKPATVANFTARHRVGMFDHTFKYQVDWGLGFMLHTDPDGTDAFAYGFGPYASAQTFGHGGFESSSAFADPERGLVVAYVFNGTPGEAEHRARRHALQAAIYEDLNLV